MATTPDWKAAADAAVARRAELGLTQEEVVARMGEGAVHIESLRRFERAERDVYRSTTLAAISKALDWPADTLRRIAHGEMETTAPGDLATVNQRLDQLEAAMAALEAAVAERLGEP